MQALMHCGSISQPRIKKEKVPQNPRRYSSRRKSVQLVVDSLTTKATRSKQTQCPILQQFISRPNSSHLHCNSGYSIKFPNKQNQWCPEDRQTHDRSQQRDLTHETDTPGKKEWERKQTSSSTSSKHRKSQHWRRCSWAGWLVTKANSAPFLSLLHSIHNPITYMMLVGIGETLLLFPRQVHESLLGFLEIQDPGFFLDHEDPKIPTM